MMSQTSSLVISLSDHQLGCQNISKGGSDASITAITSLPFYSMQHLMIRPVLVHRPKDENLLLPN